MFDARLMDLYIKAEKWEQSLKSQFIRGWWYGFIMGGLSIAIVITIINLAS